MVQCVEESDFGASFTDFGSHSLALLERVRVHVCHVDYGYSIKCLLCIGAREDGSTAWLSASVIMNEL